MTNRYRHTDLIDATTALFQQAGLEPPIARAVAETLVEADLLGYSTHGLQFVPAYLARIEKGTTRTNGEPELVHENGANLVFDAGQLPGQWAVRAVLDDALTRLPTRGVVTAVIRQCGNISCLATYVKQAADTGIMALLASSSPGNAAVAPHGGKTARYSTNPMAIGIPATPHPILIDTSTASSSNRQIERIVGL